MNSIHGFLSRVTFYAVSRRSLPIKFSQTSRVSTFNPITKSKPFSRGSCVLRARCRKRAENKVPLNTDDAAPRRRSREASYFVAASNLHDNTDEVVPTVDGATSAAHVPGVTVKMAAANSSLSTEIPAKKEDEFNEFYTEVKEIEKRDSVLTPKQQIDRLLRPGSSYFNLNPFEVLHIDPATTIDEVKKKYRRMSILVHPDKNQDDAERAQQAFEIVNKAWKTLENEETRAKCMDVIEEAKARTDHMIAEKKKKLKKDAKDGVAINTLEEETEEGYTHAVWVMTMKLFADMERRRRELATRDVEQRKRKREEELSAEAQAAMEKEWQRNFEESRQSRVDSWKAFQSGTSSATKQKKPKKMKAFRPPKTKAESR